MVRTFLVLTAGLLCGQDATNALPRNEQALKSAIAGIGKRPIRTEPQLVRRTAPPSTACSAPLVAMPIDKQQFASRQIAVDEVEPMPQVALPAPPCGSTDR